jgi:ribosomal protein L12E/L44/L45/RPP1/RPP2
MSTAELATSYAALILADDGVEITVRNDPDKSGRNCAGPGASRSEGGLILNSRPTRSRPSSRPPTSLMSSLSGPHYSPRYEDRTWTNSRSGIGTDEVTDRDTFALQALEGKDVKDLLSAVGTGGGAAAAPAAGGAAAAGGAPAEEAKEEAKEEGESPAGTHGLWAPGMRRLLTTVAEKEESDEDMGFGLFD